MLRFVPLPAGFVAALAVMIVIYLVLVELGNPASIACSRTAPRSLAGGPSANTGFITARRAGASTRKPDQLPAARKAHQRERDLKHDHKPDGKRCLVPRLDLLLTPFHVAHPTPVEQHWLALFPAIPG